MNYLPLCNMIIYGWTFYWGECLYLRCEIKVIFLCKQHKDARIEVSLCPCCKPVFDFHQNPLPPVALCLVRLFVCTLNFSQFVRNNSIPLVCSHPHNYCICYVIVIYPWWPIMETQTPQMSVLLCQCVLIYILLIQCTVGGWGSI